MAFNLCLYWSSLHLKILFLLLSTTFIASAALNQGTHDNGEHALNKRHPMCDVTLGRPKLQSCLDALFDLPNTAHTTHFSLDVTVDGYRVAFEYHVPLPYWKQIGMCNFPYSPLEW